MVYTGARVLESVLCGVRPHDPAVMFGAGAPMVNPMAALASSNRRHRFAPIQPVFREYTRNRVFPAAGSAPYAGP